MPTYDYVCLECNYEFEFFQKMTDENLTECPQCGGKLKRKIGTGLSPIFKGSGFYQTDYKKSGTSSGSTSTKKAEPKTESKPAAGSAKPDTTTGTSDTK